jgi:hypothetical protein
MVFPVLISHIARFPGFQLSFSVADNNPENVFGNVGSGVFKWWVR